jgi:hypothetical protein
MRKIIKLMVIIITIIAATQVSGAGTQVETGQTEDVVDAKPPVLAAFSATNAEIESMDINGWSQINREYMNIENMKATARKAAQVFTQDVDSFTYREEHAKGHKAVFAETRLTPQVFLQVIVTSMKPDEALNMEPHSYLVVNIIGDKTFENLNIYNELIRAAIEEAGGTPDVSTCVTGSMEGRLDEEETRELIDEAFSAAGAKSLEALDGMGFFSGCGYTPKITEYIEVLGEKVNLNIAVRYNDFESKTFVWIGTPVISVEY